MPEQARHVVVVELPEPDEDGGWGVQGVGAAYVGSHGDICLRDPFLKSSLVVEGAEAQKYAAAILAAAVAGYVSVHDA